MMMRKKKAEDLAVKLQRDTKDLLNLAIKQTIDVDMLTNVDTDELAMMKKTNDLLSTYMELEVEKAKEISEMNQNLQIMMGKLNKLNK